jgi:hypothetical protein
MTLFADEAAPTQPSLRMIIPPDLDFIDFLIVKGHEVLDDKRQGVHSVSYGVDAGSLEEEVHPWPGGAPIDGFHDALGFELFYDPHFVVDVGSERVRLGDGTFGEHDHALFFLSGFSILGGLEAIRFTGVS